ncbi:MAG: hypothetical protein ABID38_05610 [Candidatus Diapherotrites archaeon]
MELSYDEIRRIHRLERSTSRLVEVEQSFYNDLNSFITEEKEEYINSLKDFSIDRVRQFTNLKRMVEEIFSLREKKILSRALIANRTEEVSDEHMASQEKDLFNEILEKLQKHNKILNSLFAGEKNEKKKKPAKDLNILLVEIISDIPSFIGTDMKEYGPFSKGDEVKLPYKIAKLLSSRKLCKI